MSAQFQLRQPAAGSWAGPCWWHTRVYNLLQSLQESSVTRAALAAAPRGSPLPLCRLWPRLWHRTHISGPPAGPHCQPIASLSLRQDIQQHDQVPLPPAHSRWQKRGTSHRSNSSPSSRRAHPSTTTPCPTCPAALPTVLQVLCLSFPAVPAPAGSTWAPRTAPPLWGLWQGLQEADPRAQPPADTHGREALPVPLMWQDFCFSGQPQPPPVDPHGRTSLPMPGLWQALHTELQPAAAPAIALAASCLCPRPPPPHHWSLQQESLLLWDLWPLVPRHGGLATASAGPCPSSDFDTTASQITTSCPTPTP